MANISRAKQVSKSFEKKVYDKESEKDKKKTTTEDSPQVGPLVLAFLLFVVVGSALVQIFNNAKTGQIE